MDYGRMIMAHVRNGADMTVACLEVPVAEARAFGVMGVDDDWRVARFKEKPVEPDPLPGRPNAALASMGIYVFNAPFLYEQLARDAADPASSHDFGKDIIPHLVPRFRVFAHRFEDSCVKAGPLGPYWRDVGTLDAYWEANMELTRGEPDLDIYDRNWPIWTYREQSAPAKIVSSDDDCGAADSLVSSGCVVSGATIRRSVLFANVRVAARSAIEDSVILPDVEIGRHVHLRRVIVDKRCRLPDGLRVGFDLDLDRRRFQVSEKGIVLITPNFLGQ
jgi:glucose-1-phosphate adenylyltransferase